MQLKKHFNVELEARVIGFDDAAVVLRIVNNTDELNGTLIETTEKSSKLKAGKVYKFDSTGKLLETVKEAKAEKPRPAGHTGSNKPMKNI